MLDEDKRENQIKTMQMVKSALDNAPGRELMRYLKAYTQVRATRELTAFEQGKRAVYQKLRNTLDMEVPSE